MAGYSPVTLIEVKAWNTRVGAIEFDPVSQVYVFEYAPDWLASKVELAPLTMPLRQADPRFSFSNLDRQTFKGLPGMIADSLPDAFGNAVIDAYLAENGIPASRITTLDRLAYLGQRGMGVLEYHPVSTNFQHSPSAIQIADLVVGARTVIAGNIDRSKDISEAIQALIQVGSSAGGARAKAVIAFNPQTGQVRSPLAEAAAGFQPWLLKLDGVSAAADASVNSQDAPDEYTRIEYAYYLMAQASGIQMMESQLLLEGDRAHFLTKRFDVDESGERVHAQTLCALAHLDFRMKQTHSYAQYFEAILGLAQADPLTASGQELADSANALEQAFRRMVFNVAAMNRDDHTKNFGFLLGKGGSWKLAPAYDVTHAHNPVGEWTQKHQLSINGKFDGITLRDIHSVGDRFDVPGYRQIAREVLSAVSHWPDFAGEAGLSRAQTQRIANDLREHPLH